MAANVAGQVCRSRTFAYSGRPRWEKCGRFQRLSETHGAPRACREGKGTRFVDRFVFALPDLASPIPSGKLRTVDATTGEVRTLLDASVLAFFWSPDGKTIAALDLRPADDAPDPGQAGVIPAVMGGGSISTVTPLAAGTPGIGMHLSFVDAETGSIRSERDLRVSETFGFQVLPYFDQYALSHHLWAPDSSSFLMPVVAEDGITYVAVTDPAGDHPPILLDGQMAFWSP